ADLAIHLGDFTESNVAVQLNAFCPVVAVHGNNDSEELRSSLPAFAEVKVEGFRLLLIHGHVSGRTALDSARHTIGGDAVLFGHSHSSYCAWENGRLLFNPGSPTDKRWTKHRSFGMLDIGKSIQPSIVPIVDPH
ncbi:MAG TPA: metallophosphoesterase family protein, partial [Chloroflexota bacterium]